MAKAPTKAAPPKAAPSASPTPLDQQLAALAERFAREVLQTVSRYTFNDFLVMAESAHAAPAAPSVAIAPRAPVSAGLVRRAPAAPVVVASAAPNGQGIKKKRNWPKCIEEGCGGSYYPASGTARLCYNHFIASGGQHPSKRS